MTDHLKKRLIYQPVSPPDSRLTNEQDNDAPNESTREPVSLSVTKLEHHSTN